MSESNRIPEFPQGDWEGQLKYILQTMDDEDKAAGRPEASAEESKKRFDFVWAQRDKLGKKLTSLESTAPFRHDAAELAKPTPERAVSFAELLAPYYGQSLDKELTSAFNYNDQNFPVKDQFQERPLPDTFPQKSFKNFTPEKVDGGISVNEHPNKTGYDSYTDSINLGPNSTASDLEYGAGQATYGNKFNRDSGNFQDPNEMLVGLGQAQRQHFLKFGGRLTPESVGPFLDKADFSIFDENTKKALQLLNQQRQSTTPEEQKKYQDTLKILPSLVQNNPTAKQLFS